MTTLELLDEVEAEIARLRAKQKRLVAALLDAQQDIKSLEKQVKALQQEKGVEPVHSETENEMPVRRQALGKGLAQLFGPRN